MTEQNLSEWDVWFRISETLVDVDKLHISTEDACRKIRALMWMKDAPERKKGKWIAQKDGGYCCSNCGQNALALVDSNYAFVAFESNFCPHCGWKLNKSK